MESLTQYIVPLISIHRETGYWTLQSYIFFPGLFFIIFSYFGSFMVVWGLGFWVWGLWCGAFWVFWVGALYINIKE